MDVSPFLCPALHRGERSAEAICRGRLLRCSAPRNDGRGGGFCCGQPVLPGAEIALVEERRDALTAEPGVQRRGVDCVAPVVTEEDGHFRRLAEPSASVAVRWARLSRRWCVRAVFVPAFAFAALPTAQPLA